MEAYVIHENARDRGVSGASFLRIPQFVIGVELSGYRSANPRFAPAIYRSASPSDQPATRAACQSPALPSNSTSNSHRLPGSPVGSPDESPACAFNPLCRSTFWLILRLASPHLPSASPFGPACDSRRLPFLQPTVRPTSKLAPFGPSSGSAFLPASSLRLPPILRPCFRT